MTGGEHCHTPGQDSLSIRLAMAVSAQGGWKGMLAMVTPWSCGQGVSAFSIVMPTCFICLLYGYIPLS